MFVGWEAVKMPRELLHCDFCSVMKEGASLTFLFYRKMINNYDQVEFIPRVQEWLNIHKSISVTYHFNNINVKKNMIIPIDSRKNI